MKLHDYQSVSVVGGSARLLPATVETTKIFFEGTSCTP